MSKILLNEDGITVGELKQFLEGFDDDVKVSDIHIIGDTTYSSRITELLNGNEGVVMISQMSRDLIKPKQR